MTSHAITEYWVMRVLLHNGRQLTFDSAMSPGAFVGIVALVNSNDLCVLPDGVIAEPIEVFRTEPEAHEHREKLLRANPRSDFRVILNASV